MSIQRPSFKKQLPMSKFQFSNKLQTLNLKKFRIWCLVIGACLVLGFWYLEIPVFALSPTPEATPTVEEEEEATPSSEEKAKQILEAVRERIKERKKTLRRRAYVGFLKSIADTTLILESRQGIRQVYVSTEAAILRLNAKGRTKIKFEDLAIGEQTIAMGYLDENEVLDARRIIVKASPDKLTLRKAVYGIVQEVDLKEKTILVKRPHKDENWTIEITARTDFHKDAALADIQPNDRLVAIGPLDDEKENYLYARKILVLPQTPAVKLSPTESPSPTPAE